MENHTYLIKSEYLDPDATREVFMERGNWEEYQKKNSGPDFFFKDGKFKSDSSLYNINAKITNIMEKNTKHSMYAKDSLYTIFMNYNKNICHKFMVRQYNINTNNYQKITKEMFGDKIWILKAVMSSGGRDIYIVETYNDYLYFFQQKPTLYRWVLAEYIMNPLLIFDRKFHIRVYFLVTGEHKYYFQTNGFMITAAEPYVKGDYLNKKIHDTHQSSSIPDLFFPQGLEPYPADKVEYIRDQIAELCYHISQMSSDLKCYKGDPYCFEIFGIDIMVLNDFKIKLLEINEKQSWLTTYSFTKNYLRGIMETVVDPLFPPKNFIIKTNYFTPVPTSNPQQLGANNKNFERITPEGKKLYTYSIYTDTQLDDEYINEIFKSRGNWEKVTNDSATFIYIYLKGYLPENKKLWEYPAIIKNVVAPSIYQITNKSNLYYLFGEYNKMIRDKYLVKQYDINLYNYENVIDEKEFNDKGIWILKPVYSWGGIGISIFNNYTAFINTMDKNKKKLRHTTKDKKSKLKWVLAEYIDKPLLFREKKFHFRVPYLYYNGKGYVGKTFSIITAAQNYVSNDYDNKDIHDTHIKRSIKGLLFPRDFNEDISADIFNSILELFYHVTQIMITQKITCYPDTENCFEVYGADIMVTSNHEIKLLEINNNAGFTGFIHYVINGVMSTIIDKIFPPENSVPKSDFFVDVTNYSSKNLAQSRISKNNAMYQKKYLKYKLKYLKLKQFAGNVWDQSSQHNLPSQGQGNVWDQSSQNNLLSKGQGNVPANDIPEYPLYRNSYVLTREKFKELVKNFEPVIRNEVPEKMAKRFHPRKYENKYVLIEENWKKNEELNSVTDYFTEECRIKCTFGKHESPYTFWLKNQHLFKNVTNPNQIRSIMYRNTKLCNNFRISVALTILDFFNAKKWLDISAGWGDRLVAAIGHDVDLYCGVDPNECLHPHYQQIIKTLADPSKQSNYILIRDGFETADLPNTNFDLVFSSPPFFDLEVYSQSAADSLVRYSTADAWYHKFLIVSLKKAASYLEKGGHMVLYMAEGIQTNYIKNMIREISLIMKYKGIIYYYYPNKNIPRPLYVWQKI